MKYIFSFCFLFFFLLDTISAQENTIQEVPEPIEEQSNSNEDVPFAIIEEVPIFPGCESFEKLKRRKCFNDKILEHIGKHFKYPKEAIRKKIEGRVLIMFTVNKDSSIANIRKRGPHPILENEAERIISLLPNIVPGKQKGKAVRVPFAIPITFKLRKEESVELVYLPFDSLDLEPKFLDYSFLNPKKKRWQKKREVLNLDTEMKKCIQRHLSNHFRYPEIAQDKNIQGTANVELIISKNGELHLKRVKGEHNILNNEARRIVSLLPKKVIPGKKNGKAVNVIMEFPLNFKLQ